MVQAVRSAWSSAHSAARTGVGLAACSREVASLLSEYGVTSVADVAGGLSIAAGRACHGYYDFDAVIVAVLPRLILAP